MKYPILILHGWSKNMRGNRYNAIQSLLEKKGFTVLAPDLPGFGTNPLKKEKLEFDDYITFVHDYMKRLNIKKAILLGHSFGGRIAIRFSATYPNLVAKLILAGASGIPRPLPSLKKKIIYAVTKILRPFFSIPPFSLFYIFFRKLIYYFIGEMDYYKAGSLRETFKQVHKVSIVYDLPKITTPTLIVWGENDTIIPLTDGKLMHDTIKNSKLIIVKNSTHKLPYENPKAFMEAIDSFL